MESLSMPKNHKEKFNLLYPAPNFTRTLYQIGFQLAEERVYSDLVSSKIHPEKERENRISQIQPYLESLKNKNQDLKLEMKKCQGCRYKTESELVLDQHLQYLHKKKKKGLFYCGY